MYSKLQAYSLLKINFFMLIYIYVYIILWAAVNTATDLTDETGMFQRDTAHMY